MPAFDRVRSLPGAALAATTAALRRLWRDRRGNYSMIVVMLLPVIAGFTGMGTEAGMWFYSHQAMQGAADAAAFSAASLYKAEEPNPNPTDGITEALAVAAKHGYGSPNGCSVTTPGVGTTCVSVSTTAHYGAVPSGNVPYFEVVIAQSPQQLFSKLIFSNQVVISARAVGAVTTQSTSKPVTTTSTQTTTTNGPACVLALGKNNQANTVQVSGGASVSLSNCNLAIDSTASGSGGDALSVTSGATVGANITLASSSNAIAGAVTGTVTTGYATANPYTLPTPPTESCTGRGTSVSTNTTITPSGGVDVLPSLAVSAGTLTLKPGIYYVCGGVTGGFTVSGSGSVTGTGVTIVLLGTGTSCAKLSFATTGTVSLVAPTGTTNGAAYQGVAIADSGNCTAPTINSGSGNQVNIAGGSNTQITGAIVLPGYAVNYSGGGGTGSGASTCTQLIADSITLSGSASLASNCTNAGTSQVTTETTTTTTTTTTTQQTTTSYAPTLAE